MQHQKTMLTFSTENKEGRITLWKLLSPKSCVTSDQHELSKGLHPESHKCCVIFQTRPRSITTIFYNSAFFSYSPPEQTWPSQTFEPHQLPLERKQISPRESSPQMYNFYPNYFEKSNVHKVLLLQGHVHASESCKFCKPKWGKYIPQDGSLPL